MGRSVKENRRTVQDWTQRRDHLCPKAAQLICTAPEPLPHVHHGLHGLSGGGTHWVDHIDCNAECIGVLLSDRNSTDARGKIKTVGDQLKL